MLPGEEIICRSPEGIILTSDGWVALHQTHVHRGLTQIFKLLNLRDVESIELLPKADSLEGRATFAARAAYAILLLAATALFVISPFAYGSEVFLNGLDPSLCEDLGEDYTCQQTNWVKESPFWLELPALALIAMMAQYLFRFPFGSSVAINHGGGKMLVKQESLKKMESSFALSFVWSVFLMPVPGDGFMQGDSPFLAAGLATLPIGAVLWNSIKHEIRLSDPNQEEEQGRENIERRKVELTPQVSLVEFYHHLRAPLGLEGEPDGVEEVRPIQDELSSDLASIKKKLAEHDDLLMQIVSNYNDIFRGAPSQAVTSVRASTERILSFRLHRILPNPSKEVKVLSQYRDQLKKHDSSFGNDMILNVNVIIELGNFGTHRMTATKADYIAILGKFVELVNWHFDNPAQPKEGAWK